MSGHTLNILKIAWKYKKKYMKILWWRFHILCSEHLLVSSETLSWKTWNISTLSVFVYHKTNSFSLLKVSHALVCPVRCWRFKCFCWSILLSSFRSFTVSCCSLIWLFPDITSSKGLSKFTNIFRYSRSLSWETLALPLVRLLWICLLWFYRGLCFICSCKFF